MSALEYQGKYNIVSDVNINTDNNIDNEKVSSTIDLEFILPTQQNFCNNKHKNKDFGSMLYGSINLSTHAVIKLIYVFACLFILFLLIKGIQKINNPEHRLINRELKHFGDRLTREIVIQNGKKIIEKNLLLRDPSLNLLVSDGFAKSPLTTEDKKIDDKLLKNFIKKIYQ